MLVLALILDFKFLAIILGVLSGLLVLYVLELFFLLNQITLKRC